MNCLNILTPIPEAISNEPSCSNLHDLSIIKDSNNIIIKEQQPEQLPWCIYANDNDLNSKSTDALLEAKDESEVVKGEKFPSNYLNNLSFVVIENPSSFKPSSINSNSFLSKALIDRTERMHHPQPLDLRNNSDTKHDSRMYDPISNESLTDSQGYMDDFDESCALITTENDRHKRVSLSDLKQKRNSLGVNKVPQNHRFSAGDADKLEKGINHSLPSTRSLKDS